MNLLIVLSSFTGSSDKAGTRENQVGWALLSSWGGGKATGLEPPLSLPPIKFAQALFCEDTLEVLRFLPQSHSYLCEYKALPQGLPLAKGTESSLGHFPYSTGDRGLPYPHTLVS